jgi:DNA gyrase subunit A
MQRPNLDHVDPAIVAYIEYLESKLPGYTSRKNIIQAEEAEARLSEPALPTEPPTTINIVTVSQDSIAKRTPRHLFPRQHRGGMGIFDLDVPSPDIPAFLSALDEGENALVFTNLAKVYRLPANRIQEGEVRSKGSPLFDRDRLGMELGEQPVAILPERSSGYIAMVSANGKVRCLRHHLFGNNMRPGSVFFNIKETGFMVSACWSAGDNDLFIVTQKGMAIRFNEKTLNPQGDWGIKLASNDHVVAIAPVYEDSLVFIVAIDGKGTIREMDGFAANKSAGGSGKIAIKNDHVVSALSVTPNDDIFLITRNGKIIRFKADEVPSTDSVVQGVICVNMRNDEVVGATVSGLPQ